MSEKDLSKLILEYFKKGWSVELVSEHTPLLKEHTISSPGGTLYDTRKLSLNLCVICEDSDPSEFCNHSGAHNKEYESARKLGELVYEYLVRYGNTLPKP